MIEHQRAGQIQCCTKFQCLVACPNCEFPPKQSLIKTRTPTLGNELKLNATQCRKCVNENTGFREKFCWKTAKFGRRIYRESEREKDSDRGCDDYKTRRLS